jgi:hypothetical protein
MTQLGIGVAALNQESAFQAAYEKGMKKSEYWEHTLDDSLKLIARLPVIAARIYRNIYRQGSAIPAIDKDLDLVGKSSISVPSIQSDWAQKAITRASLATAKMRTSRNTFVCILRFMETTRVGMPPLIQPVTTCPLCTS